MEEKSIIFSGVQPSGNLHLGNFLGAIKNWVKLQEEYRSFFCVVDLHAITVPQDPKELRGKIIETAKIYLAAGIDPAKSVIFTQSTVSAHAELAWLLNTITPNAELTKMTQFKQKSGADLEGLEQKLKNNPSDIIGAIKDFKEQFNSVGVGLYSYPVLMAADILLYKTDVVPVGEDQTQHIELTRKLARKFNKRFGETFKMPKAYIRKEGMRIMGLDDPTKKMSKSATSKFGSIDLLDSPEEIREKIKRAVTDSENSIEYKNERPALKNLINIFALTSDKTPDEIVTQFKGQGFKEFKEELANSVVTYLSSFQEKYNSISDEEVGRILAEGTKRAEKVAQAKLKEVKQKMGL